MLGCGQLDGLKCALLPDPSYLLSLVPDLSRQLPSVRHCPADHTGPDICCNLFSCRQVVVPCAQQLATPSSPSVPHACEPVAPNAILCQKLKAHSAALTATLIIKDAGKSLA